MDTLLKKLAFLRPLLKLFGLGLIVFTIFTVIDSWQKLQEVSFTNSALIVPIVLVVLLNLVSTGQMFDSTLRPYKVNLRNFESFQLAALTRFGNYISFGQVGFLIRSYYLKKIHSMQIKKSLTTTGISTVAFYLSNSVILLVCLSQLNLGTRESSTMGTLGLIVLLLCIGLSFVSFRAVHSKIPIAKKYMPQVLVEWNVRTYVRTLIWAAISALTFVVLFYLELRVFGEYISFAEAGLIAAVASLSAIFNITPAGLGVNEGLVIIAGELIGVDAEMMLYAAVLRRFIVFSTVTLISVSASRQVFGVSLFSLKRHLKSKQEDTQSI